LEGLIGYAEHWLAGIEHKRSVSAHPTFKIIELYNLWRSLGFVVALIINILVIGFLPIGVYVICLVCLFVCCVYSVLPIQNN
jgi:hypothetical protein